MVWSKCSVLKLNKQPILNSSNECIVLIDIRWSFDALRRNVSRSTPPQSLSVCNALSVHLTFKAHRIRSFFLFFVLLSCVHSNRGLHIHIYMCTIMNHIISITAIATDFIIKQLNMHARVSDCVRASNVCAFYITMFSFWFYKIVGWKEQLPHANTREPAPVLYDFLPFAVTDTATLSKLNIFIVYIGHGILIDDRPKRPVEI